MGRLQRKKPIYSKKKKPNKANDSVNGASSNENNEKKVLPLPGFSKAKESEKQQAPSRKKMTSATLAEPKGIKKHFDKAVQFLREAKIELKKVVWPSRKQTMGSTAVVILFVIVISIFLGIVDTVLSKMIRVLL